MRSPESPASPTIHCFVEPWYQCAPCSSGAGVSRWFDSSAGIREWYRITLVAVYTVRRGHLPPLISVPENPDPLSSIDVLLSFPRCRAPRANHKFLRAFLSKRVIELRAAVFVLLKSPQYLPNCNISNSHFVIASLDLAGLTSKSENFSSRAALEWSCARHDLRSRSDLEPDSNDFNVNRSNISFSARNLLARREWPAERVPQTD